MSFSSTYYKIIIFLLLIMLLACSAKAIAMPLEWVKEPSMTETTLLHSTITQKDYRIYTSIPQRPAPTSGYPIIYLLDGHLTFSLAENINQLLTKLRLIAPIVIVGIDYAEESHWPTLRATDYTPPHNAKPVEKIWLKGEKVGGHAEQFLQFIISELKPVIEQKYAIDKTKQALFGHSYGGLFTLYVFLTKPNTFNYYFAASPSIWWDDHIILQKLEAFIKHPTNTKPISLVISVGELEQKISNDLPKARKEKLLQRKQVTNAQFFISQLSELNNSSIQSQFILFTEQNHATVIPFAIQHALLNFFHTQNSSY